MQPLLVSNPSLEVAFTDGRHGQDGLDLRAGNKKMMQDLLRVLEQLTIALKDWVVSAHPFLLEDMLNWDWHRQSKKQTPLKTALIHAVRDAQADAATLKMILRIRIPYGGTNYRCPNGDVVFKKLQDQELKKRADAARKEEERNLAIARELEDQMRKQRQEEADRRSEVEARRLAQEAQAEQEAATRRSEALAWQLQEEAAGEQEQQRLADERLARQLNEQDRSSREQRTETGVEMARRLQRELDGPASGLLDRSRSPQPPDRGQSQRQPASSRGSDATAGSLPARPRGSGRRR